MRISRWMILADSHCLLISKRVTVSFLLLFFLFQIISCSSQSQRSQWVLRGSTMGTSWSVKVIISADYTQLTKQQLNEKISSELERVDLLFSTYRKDSELSKFNQ
ncbi:MAG TPA: FAD:protein FMN transferase ApbE, partial [Crenotrichaceae bacterium]|nr:FAD:protein FMN transferase ApbE [Crenotrichaceae bacterium]